MPGAANLENWRIIYNTNFTKKQQACFLDRDGVLIEDVDYISDPADVSLIEGALEALKTLRKLGFAIIITTNQSGIARQYFNREAYLKVHDKMMASLHEGLIDAVFASPFHIDGHPPYNIDHEWRKPKTGMLDEAKRIFNLDMANSIMVGDKLSDIETGISAKLHSVFHVKTGKGETQRKIIEEQVFQTSTQINCIDSIATIGGHFERLKG